MGKSRRRSSEIPSKGAMATQQQAVPLPAEQTKRKVDRKGKGKAEQSNEDTEAEEEDELMTSLRRHDASFTALLSLIPPHLYLAANHTSDVDDDEGQVVHQSRPAKRMSGGEETASEKKANAKMAKRAKFDPDNQKTALQIQQERALNQAALEDDDADKISFAMDAGDLHAGDTDDGDEQDSGDEDDDGDSYETLPTSTKGSDELSTDKSPALNSPVSTAGTPLGVFDLRARLQAKIQGLQAQRRASNSRDGLHAASAPQDDTESTASTKDELLEERRKKRGELRDKRRKAVKERKRVEREQVSGASKSNGGNEKKGAGAPALVVAPIRAKRTDDQAKTLSNDGKSGDLTFSTMHFDGEAAKKNKHALPSDPKAALAILEARKRKDEKHQAKREAQGLSQDQSVGIDGQSHAERTKWSKAEAAAQGVKIREDESLLKKALKRKEKQKSQSAKDWKKRGKDLESQQVARQKKRTDNIAARKERKTKGAKGGKSSSSSSVKGKLIGARKNRPGSSSAGSQNRKARPGFEGKRRMGGGKAGGSGGKKSSR